MIINESNYERISKQKKPIREGIVPFVEPNSIEEEMAFNELIFINKQIGTLTEFLKK